MLAGLYSAATGMETQQAQLDAISGNVANVDTPGYQSVQVGFQDLLYFGDDDDPSSSQVGAGSSLAPTGFSQTQGSLQQTGNPLDVALEGPGYLQVRMPGGGVGLTRSGALQLTSTGQLTAAGGLPLEPPVNLPRGTRPSEVSIAGDGTVSVSGRAVGRLSVVDVPAPDHLMAGTGTLYTPTVASGAVRAATGTRVHQGLLEGSNVDEAYELTNMADAEQGYSLSSRAAAIENQMGQIAANLK